MRVMAQRGICSVYSWRARRLLTLERSCPWMFRIFKLFERIISLCVATQNVEGFEVCCFWFRSNCTNPCRIWRQVRMTWKMMQIERYAHPKLRATMLETIVNKKMSCEMARHMASTNFDHFTLLVVHWLRWNQAAVYAILITWSCDSEERNTATLALALWRTNPGASAGYSREHGAISNDNAASVGIKKWSKAADGPDGHQD